MVEKLPIFKGAIYNAVINEDTNFFASDLTPTDTPTTFLIYFYKVSGDNTFPRLIRTNGSNTLEEVIWSGGFGNPQRLSHRALLAPGDFINFKTPVGAGNTGVGVFIVVEIETV